jgi:uncharacterized protein (DUF58 family)
MLAKDLIKRIRHIQIRTSHLVSDALAGQYHSAFKGRGMEFEEVRPYQVGDEIRTIDWNVSARVGEPHVKLFREERELTVMLAVDLSGSQSFGTQQQLKRELLAEIAATLAFSAIRNNDKVGLICFTDRVEKFVPPRKGPKHVLRIVRELLALKPEGSGTAVGPAIEELARVLRKRGVVFVLSDFMDDGYERALRTASRRHDVIPILVSDRREEELPNVGLVEFTDAETGRRTVIDTGRRRVRDRFAAQAGNRRKELASMFRRMRMDPIEVRTGESFVDPLTAYFRRRGKRRSR